MTPVRSSRLNFANGAMKRRNALSNARGSKRRNPRLNVSRLGIPCSSRRIPRSSTSLERPNRAMSEGPSAPHSTAAKAMNRISHKSWLPLSALGSANLRKTFLNLPIRLPLRFGSRPQNPYSPPMQHEPQSQMRFPCLSGGGILHQLFGMGRADPLQALEHARRPGRNDHHGEQGEASRPARSQ